MKDKYFLGSKIADLILCEIMSVISCLVIPAIVWVPDKLMKVKAANIVTPSEGIKASILMMVVMVPLIFILWGASQAEYENGN